MSIDCGPVRIRAGFLFFAWVAFLVCCGGAGRLPLLFLCAVWHEAGHAAALFLCGARRITVVLHPGGASIRDAGVSQLPYGRLCAAAFAGPAANLVAAGALRLAAVRSPSDAAAELVRIHLLLCCVNLLPLSFLDGGAGAAALYCALRKPDAPPDPAIPDLLTLAALCGGCVWLLAKRLPAWHALAFTGYCILYEFSLPLRASYDKIKK